MNKAGIEFKRERLRLIHNNKIVGYEKRCFVYNGRVVRLQSLIKNPQDWLPLDLEHNTFNKGIEMGDNEGKWFFTGDRVKLSMSVSEKYETGTVGFSDGSFFVSWDGKAILSPLLLGYGGYLKEGKFKKIGTIYDNDWIKTSPKENQNDDIRGENSRGVKGCS